VSEALERTADGHRIRLRYGKGLRARFLIRALDEAVAEYRASKLRDLAAQLVAAGHSAEAHMILTEAAGAASDRDFDAYIKVGEQFCRDKGKKKTARAATTFGKLAEQWTDGTLTREHPDHVGTKKTADHDVSRLETICAVPVAPGLRFGDLPLGSVTVDHCETVMRNLPDSAKRRATRRHYALVIHRVLALAVFPCRLIAASPLPRGGKSEAWIGDRTGHRSSIMINRYKRSARTAAELGLGPLHPLDAAIPELAPPKHGGPKGGPRRRRGAPQATAVAPPGLEPGRYFYRGILNPLRLPIPPRGPVSDCNVSALLCSSLPTCSAVSCP
jgi:hypothetical protein